MAAMMSVDSACLFANLASFRASENSRFPQCAIVASSRTISDSDRSSKYSEARISPSLFAAFKGSKSSISSVFSSGAVSIPTAPAATSSNLREVIELLIERKDLTQEQTSAAMDSLLLESASPAQIAAFLVLLRAKGETPDEISGLALAMRRAGLSVPLPADVHGQVLDIVGTGGDGANTVNISTGACVLAAACGAKVAKHGNRSVSSACGSADVLEALGVEVELNPESVARCVTDCGIGFMFAPTFHPAMKVVSPVRKALSVRTAFNLLGPMLNPAVAPYALVGVFNKQTVDLMARSLQRLGIKRALVVHSKGLDEISPMGPAEMLEVTHDQIKSFHVDPLDFGIARCTVEDLRGGNKSINAKLLREAFGGKKGAIADAMILNAAAGLLTCGLVSSFGEGVERAREAQESGRALQVLNNWVELSQDLKA